MKIVRLSTLVGIAAVGLSSLAYANPITVPTGLTPGEQYRLAFVTDNNFSNAESTNINTYNTAIQDLVNSTPALAALDVSWYVIGSTASESAIANIGIDDVPVYNLNGQLVADNDGTGVGGMWSSGLVHAIDIDQQGSFASEYVYTGTTATGSVQTGEGLGSTSVLAGIDNTAGWTSAAGANPNAYGWSLYGISGVITYDEEGVGSVPEPGTISLMLLGGTFLVGKMRKKFASSATEN